MNRYRYLLLAILLLAILVLGCQLGGGGDLATPTPLPPAARTGMDALNAQSAEGLAPDCSAYPIWMACRPELAPIPQKELP